MTLIVRSLREVFARFRSDDRGQIAIIFALSSVALLLGVGAGVDLARAYSARQRLSEVANLACQFSTRPSVSQTASSSYSGTNGFQTYVNAVNAFATNSLTSQNWTWATPTGASGSTGVYFTATPAGGGSSTPTNGSVTLNGSVPTALMQLAHVTQIPVHATINCQSASAAPPIVNPGTVLQEGFETPCGSYCWTQPNGSSGTVGVTPTQTFPTTASYTGSNGSKWYIVGYCLETDVTGIINSTSPEGSHTAELDCDNGSGSAGNSSISTQSYLAAGTYELRYFYRSRVDYPDYDPTYICGTTAAGQSWANSNNFSMYRSGTVSRTNQINVYLDMNVTGSAPLHTTLDGTQQLAGANLIDQCVYAQNWVERSVRISVTTPAFYWLSFAADGQNDSYGGQIDFIRLCQDKCAGTLHDNFPPTWLAANNGGVNKVLFEDTFDAPTRSADASPPFTNNQTDLNLSVGTSGTSSSGYPNQTPIGWAIAPYNHITYTLANAYQGTQYIELDGANPANTAQKNRMVSRAFVLDPGYYQVSYGYIAMVTWSGVTATYCFAAPANGLALTPQASATGRINYSSTSSASIYTSYDTNIIGVFMSNGLLASTPVPGGAHASQTSFVNPDNSVTTTPTVWPDAVNWNSYNASQVNPAIDVCGFAPSWQSRNVAVKITKPGNYSLTFSANGSTVDSAGGGIDDVKLIALNSPYGSAPSIATTTIPVPAPQPDSTYTNSGAFNGFSIVADPLTPPGGP